MPSGRCAPGQPTKVPASCGNGRLRCVPVLHTQRTQAETRLTALTNAKPRAADPAILDELPYCEDILPGLPPALKARLFAAIDLHIVWNKTGGQVTVYATITDATLTALADLLNPGQDGYHDTAAPAPASNHMWGLPQPPIGGCVSAHMALLLAGAGTAVSWYPSWPGSRMSGRAVRVASVMVA